MFAFDSNKRRHSGNANFDALSEVLGRTLEFERSRIGTAIKYQEDLFYWSNNDKLQWEYVSDSIQEFVIGAFMQNIFHQFQINAPRGKVFDAMTSPIGLNAWWTLDASGTPELNSTYRLYFGPDYDWQAIVSHVVPEQELTWKMTCAMDDWLPTSVGFRLVEADGGRTNVQFFHTDWQTAGDHFAVTNFCWGHLLHGLKEYVEKGIIVPYEQRN